MTRQTTNGSGARKRPASPTQQLHLRLPRELHELLAKEAQTQGVTLNSMSVALLAGALSWRARKQDKERSS